MPHYLYHFKRALADDVQVVMTSSAAKFITPYTMRLVSRRQVITDMFQEECEFAVPHIELAKWAELLLVAPATASVISRVASGLCDDIVSLLCICCKCPVIFAPSMNGDMWFHPLVQRNVETLRSVGFHFIDPTEGVEIATMGSTFGVMPSPDVIATQLNTILSNRASTSADGNR